MTGFALCCKSRYPIIRCTRAEIEPAAFIASPVFNVHGRIIGFITLELGNQHVFRVFKDYSGLGSTGETLVVMRSGDELTFVAPPKK